MTTRALTVSTGNRLAKSEPKERITMTAAEWAAEARERGKTDIARAWDQRAAEQGLDRIPNGTGIRFREVDGVWETYHVDITRGPSEPRG